MNQEKIGIFIASLRKERGLTQTALAEMLGISNRTVSKWENGDGLPDISLLPAIAKTFGITVDELLAGERNAAASEIKVTEVANGDTMKNQFQIAFVISLFFALVAGLLGTFTNIYGIWAFHALFYNHWEIIFDAVGFFSLLLSVPVYAVGVIRLRLSFSDEQVKKLSFRKGARIALIDAAFLCAFIGRLTDHALSVSGVLAHFIKGASPYHANIAAYTVAVVLFAVCAAVYAIVLKKHSNEA